LSQKEFLKSRLLLNEGLEKASSFLPNDFVAVVGLSEPKFFPLKLGLLDGLEESESFRPSLKNGLLELFLFMNLQHHCCIEV
jgi:hypothetical protein